MNDSWDWIQSELKKIEEELPSDSQMLEVVDAISVADFWKRRYDEERMLWERKLQLKEDEKLQLKEKTQMHEMALKELEWKLKELERRWEQEKLLLEDRLKAKELEAEIHKNKLQWETRISVLEKENAALRKRLSNITGVPLSKLDEESLPVVAQQPSSIVTDAKIKELEERLRQAEYEYRQSLKKLEEEKNSILKQLEEKEKNFLQEKSAWETVEKEITQINQLMTERLKQLRGREQDHFSVLEDLARGFAHRVRNYLGIISGTVQLCVANYKMDDELKNQLSIVEQNVSDMLKSIEEFLSLAKIPQMNLQKLSLQKVIEKVLSSLDEKLKSSNISVEKKFVQTPELEIDEKLISEALTHIINNSIEAMPSGGLLTIETEHIQEKSSVLLKITDTGAGISDMHLKKIFQPYFTTKKNKKGLGLTAAKRIADLHGATLNISSIKSKGTTVIIQFLIK